MMQDGADMNIDILMRSDWGADPVEVTQGHVVTTGQFVGIMVHHMASRVPDPNVGDVSQLMREVQRERPDLSTWPSAPSDIPYHWAVAAGPTPDSAFILEGRGKGRTGAHCPNFNSNYWGVAVMANTIDHPEVMTAGVEAAIKLIASWLDDPAGAQPTLGHFQKYPTACPGTGAIDALPALQPPFDPALTPSGIDPAPPAPPATPTPPAPAPRKSTEDEMLIRRSDGAAVITTGPTLFELDSVIFDQIVADGMLVLNSDKLFNDSYSAAAIIVAADGSTRPGIGQYGGGTTNTVQAPSAAEIAAQLIVQLHPSA
jgi:N-acetylmuramoyl-L-alanine amidase